MPEAIATTKRKFYRALDALTNASSSTSSASPSNASNNITRTSKPVSAAAAFDEARERAKKRLRHSVSTSSLPAVEHATIQLSTPRSIAAKTPPTTSTRPSTPSTPNFTPSSQDEFLARLKTFSNVSLWHPKPEPIGEVEWAKRGWVCTGVNTVACKGGCEQRVVVSLDRTRKEAIIAVTENNADEDDAAADDDDDATAALEQAMTERYKTLIINGHTISCLWRRAGCKDDIYRLPLVRPSIWQPGIRERTLSLLNIHTAIENVQLLSPSPSAHTLPIPTLLADLPPTTLGLASRTHPSAPKALQIALHGWRASSEASTSLLTCDACFQRIGLWMYQPDYRSRHTHDPDDPDHSDAPPTIDLTEMHRDHCPWKIPASQHALGSLMGLNATQILARVAATGARDHRRRSQDPNALSSSFSATAEPETVTADAIPHPNSNQDDPNTTQTPLPKLETQPLPTTPTPTTPPSSSSSPPANRAAIAARRAETARLDKERESRLRKLKGLFSLKRRPAQAKTASS